MAGLYIVTGAEGFLGSHIVRQLRERGSLVRACVLRNDDPRPLAGLHVDIVRCDITDPTSLDRAFDHDPDLDTVVIHCAGIVSIARRIDPLLQRTNVGGTANVIAAARRHQVRRLVYTSSVHALTLDPPGVWTTEKHDFSPRLVNGAYAKTKAQAACLVMAAQGIEKVLVFPAGIWGPGDYGPGHLTQMLIAAVTNPITITVPGGHDVVDVRDVAAGTIAAADLGRDGACYLLTGEYVDISAMIRLATELAGRPRPIVLPTAIARLAAVPAERWYRLRRRVPTLTSYSLEAVANNSHFDHALAARELGYRPRTWRTTIADTVEWLQNRPVGSSPGQLQRSPAG